MNAVVLDDEAVAALQDVTHSKHGRMLAHLQGAVGRRRRGDMARVVVPCAVRVEAGWDRSSPGSAAINRFPVSDVALDAVHANAAAAIATRDKVSVADAHVGAVVTLARWSDVVVLSSDPKDMRRVCSPASIKAVLI